jgi:DNA-directed RNA polymerase subunit L
MDIEYIKKDKEELEFVVKDEDIAIYNMIIDVASSKREVEFVSKKDADLQKKEFTIYLKTKDKNAKDVLLECIDEVEEKIENTLKHLEKAAEKIEE